MKNKMNIKDLEIDPLLCFEKHRFTYHIHNIYMHIYYVLCLRDLTRKMIEQEQRIRPTGELKGGGQTL